jgi:hypothetical protein
MNLIKGSYLGGDDSWVCKSIKGTLGGRVNVSSSPSSTGEGYPLGMPAVPAWVRGSRVLRETETESASTHLRL